MIDFEQQRSNRTLNNDLPIGEHGRTARLLAQGQLLLVFVILRLALYAGEQPSRRLQELPISWGEEHCWINMAAGLIERTSFGSDGYSIDVWVMRPRKSGKFPVVIYNHGSRVQADGRIDSSCSTLGFDTPIWSGVSAGHCAVIFPEGRGYGASTGPRLENCKSWEDVWGFLNGRARDVVAGVTWLQSQSWADPSRILVCGCSHGGIVSFLAQADLTVSGTVMQAPAVGDQSQDASTSELIRALDRSTAPVLIQHAHHDLYAPIEFSRSLHRRGCHAAKDIRLREYPFRPCLSSHDQFAWHNLDIWGPDFDRFVCEALGVNGHLVCDPL